MKKQTGCREEFHHFYRLGIVVAFREFRMGCVSFAPWPPNALNLSLKELVNEALPL
ncbi:hypothetical protein [Paraburkholderia terricola]|uniref:hypothetical protein n=1 Tax=Paraburkholderia terricola TaxID=169427 RepID=UPI0013564D82|nr:MULTISPECIES: hypothetical protein [Paraburkholderia]